MALESPLVQAEAVAAMEFFDLSNQYEVSGVPHTVILDEKDNLLHTVVGGVPEQYMLDELKSKIK
jgi:thioredoxin-related protein